MIGMPGWSTNRLPVRYAVRPSVEPTERSTLRVMITTVWPTASSSRIDGVSSRSRQLSPLNKNAWLLRVVTSDDGEQHGEDRDLAGAEEPADDAAAGGDGAGLDQEGVGAHADAPAEFAAFGGGVHDVLRGGLGARDVGGDAALTDDEHAVGHAEDLGELGADHQDGEALTGEVGEQAVHLGLGADVDAARGLVDDQQLGLGGQPLGDDHLLLVAAAHRGRGHVEGAGLDLELGGPRAGRPVLGAGGEQAEAGEPAADPAGHVAGDRALGHQALLAAVLGDERHAGADRGAGVVPLDRPAEQADRARVVRVDAEDGPGDLAAPGADEARPARRSRRPGR